MRRALSVAFGLALAASGLTVIPAAAETPLWVTHVQHFPGGISDGVRAKLTAAALTGGVSGASGGSLRNVQINDETNPDLPLDETAVAFDPNHPMIAVASANDFNFPGGLFIGRTANGGRTWSSLHKAADTSTGHRCVGSDPSVVFSQRDQAFFVSTLCFFFNRPDSEIDVWKSVDDGITWTPSDKAAVAISNLQPTGPADASVFFDKELLAVDNDPASPHFGRLYLTFIKFHMLPSGFSDFCPVQLASTDNVPTADPTTTVWSHTAVVPDLPQDQGVGPGANQWALPVVDTAGGLDIAYASEDCNTGFDRTLFFNRSVDGGSTFGTAVQINRGNEFVDNPDLNDLLPNKHFRAPLSPSLAFNPTTGTLDFVYQNNVNRAVSGADISFQQSRDFGKHWSHARFISITVTGAPAPNDQYEPWLAVDEAGNLHAIWYDNRNDPGNKLIETFEAFSPNDGASWTNADISTTAWNPDTSFFACGCFIGDYTGFAASNAVRYPVWTDGRNSPGLPRGSTDIFTNVEISG